MVELLPTPLFEEFWSTVVSLP